MQPELTTLRAWLVIALLAAGLPACVLVTPAAAQDEGAAAGEPAAGDQETDEKTGEEKAGERKAGEKAERKEAGEEAAEKAPEKPAEPEPDRITFSVKLTDARGGGTAEGSAGAFEYQEGEYLIATGGVVLKYQDLTFKADRMRVDIPTNQLTAEGDVILDEGPERLVGATLDYDLETRTGRVTAATALVSEPGYYFTGDEIAKIGERTYTAVDGIFTSCLDQEVPDWSLRMSRAQVTLEGYARIRNPRMRFKNVPMFYLPYVVWPAKSERSSGFLIPKPGYSSRRGAYLGMAYFQTLGRSADTTFYADLFSEEYFGFGNEFRYRPSDNSKGSFRGHLMTEPDMIDPEFVKVPLDPSWEQGDDRWELQYYHESNQLWGGFRGIVAIEEYSDFDYLQDYKRDASVNTRSVIRSQAYLSRNWGLSSLNVLADQNKRISRGFVTTLRQLPEVEYRLRNLRLGSTPLYLSLLSSLHYFDVDRSETPNGVQIDYGRADLFPTLSIPFSTLPWLSAKVDLSYRVTWYEKSGVRNPDEVPAGADPIEFFQGGSLTRAYPQGALEVVGPSFSRIFEKPIGPFTKFKHLIEPRINYVFIDDLGDTMTIQDNRDDRTSRIIQFDEVDGILPANFAVFSITNRLLAKRAPKEEEADEEEVPEEGSEEQVELPEDVEDALEGEGEEGEDTEAESEEAGADDTGDAVEIASFELAQAYSFDEEEQPGQERMATEDTTAEGPLVAALRINPSQHTSFKVDAVYNTLFDEVQSVGVSGGTRFGYHALGLTWRNNRNLDNLDRPDRDVTTTDQWQIYTTLGLVRDRLKLDSYLSYDAKTEEILQQRHVLKWEGKCLGLALEYRDSQLNIRGDNGEPIQDRDYRFSLTLRNVGTFLDFGGSLDSN